MSANSVIHSDEWRGYYNLPQFVTACIQHNTVNHTYNFVDPAAGAHTQVGNKFLLYVILLLLPFWLITALDIDWYYGSRLVRVVFLLVIKYAMGGLKFLNIGINLNNYFIKEIIPLKYPFSVKIHFIKKDFRICIHMRIRIHITESYKGFSSKPFLEVLFRNFKKFRPKTFSGLVN